MGTVLSVRIEGVDRPRALSASEAAADEVARVEELLSTWKRGGALDRLNRAPAGRAVEVGGEVASLLRALEGWTSRTRGAFDPTVLPLIFAWDLRGAGRIPDRTALSDALSATGWRSFSISGVDLAARGRAGSGIDEGAWAKGYALDRSRMKLADAGVRRATVDLGGQVMVLGTGAVEIADPGARRGRTAAGSIEVRDASVSTSGNSERSRTVGGERIGHLLDPRSGRPARDFGSATVVAASGLAADVLSTAFFVLGPEAGLELSNELNRQGFTNEALFLVATSEGVKPLVTPGLRFHAHDPHDTHDPPKPEER
jgi:thiamine biosynthesis lipoprotein